MFRDANGGDERDEQKLIQDNPNANRGVIASLNENSLKKNTKKVSDNKVRTLQLNYNLHCNCKISQELGLLKSHYFYIFYTGDWWKLYL